ncbi:transporter substrate-binding domain-containing protein [Magnetospirillum sp. 15-1]|uniref:substrate-binding periplasmic protein n=1 Tax=Magnetospirillum sp. 15-1 TaxID=1979370 RepID=UPI000BBC1B35|nr:transporter substrate-binding domain-containing protein [Magnetospirillum sp. 15-1]
MRHFTWEIGRAVALGLLALCMALPRPGQADDVLRFSTGMIDPWTNAAGTGFHQLLIREMLTKLGRAGELEVIPASSRGIKLADDGIIDGLTGRVAGLEREYPNLVAVPERMFVNDFVACTLPGGKPPADWAATAPFSVAYVIGWQIFEHNLPPVRQLTTVKDSAHLLGLLRAGRVELILHERWQILWLARELNIALVCAEPPLAKVPMFIYLNRRHAGMVPALADILRRMKSDGSYEAIASRVFGGLGASVTGLQ